MDPTQNVRNRPTYLDNDRGFRPLNVVVTGGSSGIGSSITCKFASEGHNVLATYFSNKKAVEQITNQYKNVEFCELDQGDYDSVEAFADHAASWLKRSEPNGQGSMTVEGYVRAKHKNWETLSEKRRRALADEALMKVNSLGPLWVTEVLLQHMRGSSNGDDNKARERTFNYLKSNSRNYTTVLFLGSVGGGVGVFPEYRAADLMSKAAVTYLSKHLAAEHIRCNIDVLCLAPGATNTEMFRQSTLDKCPDPVSFMSRMPKQRILDPEEIAEMAYILCTEKSARMLHGGMLDASLGLGVRPGLQTEMQV